MTKEKVLEVCEKYKWLLEPFSDYTGTMDFCVDIADCQAMIPEIRKFAEQGRLMKAGVWIGHIQGILRAHRLRTIDQMREDNREKPDA